VRDLFAAARGPVHPGAACRSPDLLSLAVVFRGIGTRERRGTFAYYSLSAGAIENVRGLLELPAVRSAA
jgi:hypothetical protein